MLPEAARMGCPIIPSRNSPTSLAVSLAEAWNLTLVGYVRRSTLRAYTHPERLGYRPDRASPPAGRRVPVPSPPGVPQIGPLPGEPGGGFAADPIIRPAARVLSAYQGVAVDAQPLSRE